MSEPFFVERTCTEIDHSSHERISRPLKEYREQAAYVLLGDPGAGKTKAFEREAKESGGEYIQARDFATFDPSAEYQNKILFIDGLDEMRAGGGDGRTPLDQIRRHLEKLGRPHFRLSCREADWLGASDAEALVRVSPDGKITALHLDPLSDQDIVEILRSKASISDAEGFIGQARNHGLGDLLRNPQTLNLLVQAVENKQWPQSRREVYGMACQQLAREINPEHRQAKRGKFIANDTLLDAAGYLCAIQLLSGLAGYALDDDAINSSYTGLQGLANPTDLPLIAALKTNLFQGDGEDRRIPIHRSVAEYLGARYVANAIKIRSLPIGRVLALMTGEDGGVVTDLRGLSAWLSVHCPTERALLIERDPLGVVLYGDVKNFPPNDKKRILDAMHSEACRYPWFRSDDWSSPPFGALGTIDMEHAFKQILASSSRADADQALLDCVLDAIRHGERMPMLAESLNGVARDASYWPRIRKDALNALMCVTPDDTSHLLKLAEDIQTGAVEDRDDELLGTLLRQLYPNIISPERILDYLHPQKARNLLGAYFMFWVHELPGATPKDDLPSLLDQLAQRKINLETPLSEHQLNRMVGETLVLGLKAHGDAVADERLYDWLGAGLDKYVESRLEQEHAKWIAQWFEDRPDRYKAMLVRGTALCSGHEDVRNCLYDCSARLYGATPPADIVSWYLARAAEGQQTDFAQYYFEQAVNRLRQQDSPQYLTFESLEFLDKWTAEHPSFQQWLDPLVTCRLNDGQQKHAISKRERNTEQRKKKNAWISSYRKHLAEIRDGSAPAILHELALAYKGLLYEAHGETPQERLADFLDGDKELMAAAYEGFRHVLAREDLPTVAEIVDLEVKGRMYSIRWPCLVGMGELYQADPSAALKLDDAVLSRLAAFRLTDNTGDDPAWFTTLTKERSALVAEVLVAYALPMLRARQDHVVELYSVAYDDAYADVARIVLPILLEGFPLRAGKNQLANALDPLMKAALHYLDRKALAQLIARKLELKSLDSAQRVYWLACGLAIAPEIYEAKLIQYIGKSEVRRNYLAGFFHSRHERRMPNVASLPETTVALLIELLAPDCSPERPTEAHWVSPAMETADLVRSLVNTLGDGTSEIASQELERLLALPKLSGWHNALRRALHSQRIARRKASFSRLGCVEVSRTLANLEPASAADLAALAFDHLRDIARKIRDGSTNDYRQYWSYDTSNKKLSNPKPENDCRNALLSDLEERFGRLNIEAEKEGNYADDTRADIKISFGGTHGFNIPIEIKRDKHPDLWSAIGKQLIARYVRDPGTDGHGIYLVFWFGGEGMPPAPGGKRPRSAKELEDRLRSILTPEESHRIQVCVIDCSLPNVR
ncbi:MAG: hypothetical protein Q8Q81_04765 [Oxalobacteraceae bacterium]|nr:hypothetical protein [Oxalobacteraceae bacterium]